MEIGDVPVTEVIARRVAAWDDVEETGLPPVWTACGDLSNVFIWTLFKYWFCGRVWDAWFAGNSGNWFAGNSAQATADSEFKSVC